MSYEKEEMSSLTFAFKYCAVTVGGFLSATGAILCFGMAAESYPEDTKVAAMRAIGGAGFTALGYKLVKYGLALD